MRRFSSVCALSVSLPLALSSAPAFAGKQPAVLTKVPASTVGEIIDTMGHSKEITTDNQGDPLIKVNSSELKYQVLFYNCDGPAGCEAIQFRAWWGTQGKIGYEVANMYNIENRIGRAYLDKDKDPTIELLVELTGGVTVAHLAEEHKRFLQGAKSFSERIGEAMP